MLTFFRPKSSPQRVAAEKLYAAIVAQARQTVFFAELGVPDSVDGRFDMILLHAFVVMRRLKTGDKDALALSQAVYDVMFVDMDRAVREMGVGDLSVKRHIRRMMKAFNGRITAYDETIGGFGALREAIRRNVYGTMLDDVTADQLDQMAFYLKACVAVSETLNMSDVMKGVVRWPAVPTGVAPARTDAGQDDYRESA